MQEGPTTQSNVSQTRCFESTAVSKDPGHRLTARVFTNGTQTKVVILIVRKEVAPVTGIAA